VTLTRKTHLNAEPALGIHDDSVEVPVFALDHRAIRDAALPSGRHPFPSGMASC
jgi:hypothetical protein